MAPVEIDHVPRSLMTPVKNMKVVDKALSLPLVSSACSEVSRVTSPYMESTLTPVMEMVSPVVDGVKSRVEEQLSPHIPARFSETVQTVQSAAVDQVIAAVEKVDSIACGGIDQLTEKVPQLKDATPKLIEDTKISVTSFVTGWSEYLASFSVALVTLKGVDAALDKVQEVLKATECDTAKSVSDVVKTIHATANTLRSGAVRRAGTPEAKKIEESTITESLMEISGFQILMERFRLVTKDLESLMEVSGLPIMMERLGLITKDPESLMESFELQTLMEMLGLVAKETKEGVEVKKQFKEAPIIDIE